MNCEHDFEAVSAWQISETEQQVEYQCMICGEKVEAFAEI